MSKISGQFQISGHLKFQEYQDSWDPCNNETVSAKNTAKANQANLAILDFCTQVYCDKYSCILFVARYLFKFKKLSQESMTRA